jgi:hypothetical protein
MNMIKWPSISQFREVVRNVQHKARFKGVDDNGDAIFDPFVKLPTLKFKGTVKLHGTNASVAMDKDGVVWCQSRENIITPEKDNAGFAMFARANEDAFNDLLFTAREVFGHDTLPNAYLKDIVIWGEWCGSGIQKGVAISELPKMFVIFGIALVDNEGHKTYFTEDQVKEVIGACSEYVAKPGQEGKIFCIWDFQSFEMLIDFENPHESQNNLNAITEAVEAVCPVGKAFNKEGVGEGVVWRCIEEGWEDSGFFFKVKGDKHSNSKVKTLATVDVEKINNLKALAERLAHNGRLEQAEQCIFNTLNGGEVDVKKTGDMIRWVMQDIFKEDVDVIAASGFTGKDINGPVSKIVRDFIMKKLEM